MRAPKGLLQSASSPDAFRNRTPTARSGACRVTAADWTTGAKDSTPRAHTMRVCSNVRPCSPFPPRVVPPCMAQPRGRTERDGRSAQRPASQKARTARPKHRQPGGNEGEGGGLLTLLSTAPASSFFLLLRRMAQWSAPPLRPCLDCCRSWLDGRTRTAEERRHGGCGSVLRQRRAARRCFSGCSRAESGRQATVGNPPANLA
jgi:hypothetical protein